MAFNFAGLRVLVTAGPTWTPVDRVRVLTSVFSGETGLRLARHFQGLGADVTLIADSAVGFLLRNNSIDKVIVGSDRSAANGDFANKIGTYQIAVLAKEFGIPFYVLTQPSNKINKGEDIPIEIRDPEELLTFEGRRIAPKGTEGFYPGFDVVSHDLVTQPIELHVR